MDLTGKFVVDRDFDNEFTITIKKDNSTIPIVIDPSDTFEFRVYKLSGGTAVISKSLGSGVVVSDAGAGQIRVTITAAEASSLETVLGDKADRYYIKPEYRGAIKCVTVDNGEFIAYINEIYVR